MWIMCNIIYAKIAEILSDHHSVKVQNNILTYPSKKTLNTAYPALYFLSMK